MLTNEKIYQIAKRKNVNEEMVINFLTNIYSFQCHFFACVNIISKIFEENINLETSLALEKGSELAFKDIQPDCKHCQGVDLKMILDSDVPFPIIAAIGEETDFASFIRELHRIKKMKPISDEELE